MLIAAALARERARGAMVRRPQGRDGGLFGPLAAADVWSFGDRS
jgi:hypothetical protein